MQVVSVSYLFQLGALYSPVLLRWFLMELYKLLGLCLMGSCCICHAFLTMKSKDWRISLSQLSFVILIYWCCMSKQHYVLEWTMFEGLMNNIWVYLCDWRLHVWRKRSWRMIMTMKLMNDHFLIFRMHLSINIV